MAEFRAVVQNFCWRPRHSWEDNIKMDLR